MKKVPNATMTKLKSKISKLCGVSGGQLCDPHETFSNGLYVYGVFNRFPDYFCTGI